jgi:hypothetical protein
MRTRKLYLWLMLIGNLAMSFTMFTRSFFTLPESVADFLKGIGVALVFGACVIMVRQKRASACRQA